MVWFLICFTLLYAIYIVRSLDSCSIIFSGQRQDTFEKALSEHKAAIDGSGKLVTIFQNVFRFHTVFVVKTIPSGYTNN